MNTIHNGLSTYAYWPGRMFVYVGGIDVIACARECACVRECVCLPKCVRAEYAYVRARVNIHVYVHAC